VQRELKRPRRPLVVSKNTIVGGDHPSFTAETTPLFTRSFKEHHRRDAHPSFTAALANKGRFSLELVGG
jgi:hypothetical protein